VNHDLRRRLLREGFEIDRPAGGGGSSTVYRGRDLGAGRLVAVKILTDETEDARQRFAREAVVLADLSHEGIVSYVAHGEAGGAAYLVTEWVDGETLAERLHGEGLTLRESVAMTRTLATALAAIHERGLVHRDVKPSNIVFRERGGMTPVLIDFGIARSAMAPRAITGTGIMVGTPGFVSPEQARGLTTVGPPSDIFSLGCVLHLMLTGRAPFSGTSSALTFLKILNEQAVPLRRSRPEAPVLLEDLLGDMLDKTPARRPADGAALLRRLELIAEVPEGQRVSIARPLAPTTGRRARSSTGETGTGRVTDVEEPIAVLVIGPGDEPMQGGELDRIIGLATGLIGAPDVTALPQEVVLIQAHHAQPALLVSLLIDLVSRCRAELGDRVFCIAPFEHAEWAVDTAHAAGMARLFGAQADVTGEHQSLIIHETLAPLVEPPYTTETSAERITVRRMVE
jgi:hypothetical protein